MAEKKKVLHIVIDSLRVKYINQNSETNPLYIINRKTYSIPKQKIQQLFLTSADLHFEWKDTIRLSQTLDDTMLLTEDDFRNNNNFLYSNNTIQDGINASKIESNNHRKIYNTDISTPLFSEDGKRCWIEAISWEGWYEIFLLKKNKDWELVKNVSGIQNRGSGTIVTPEEYYKLTGKKLVNSKEQ